jgi:hypothetical protein
LQGAGFVQVLLCFSVPSPQGLSQLPFTHSLHPPFTGLGISVDAGVDVGKNVVVGSVVGVKIVGFISNVTVGSVVVIPGVSSPSSISPSSVPSSVSLSVLFKVTTFLVVVDVVVSFVLFFHKQIQILQ